MAKIKFDSMPKVERYLRLKGIPKDYIYAMRNALISDAITQADGFTVARFYTAFGLVCHKCYKRLMAKGYDGAYYTEAEECIDDY